MTCTLPPTYCTQTVPTYTHCEPQSHCVSSCQPSTVANTCCVAPEQPIGHTESLTVPAVLEQPMEYHEWVTPRVHTEHHRIHHTPNHDPYAPPERGSRANWLRREKKYYYRDPQGRAYSYRFSKDGVPYDYNRLPY